MNRATNLRKVQRIRAYCDTCHTYSKAISPQKFSMYHKAFTGHNVSIEYARQADH